MGIHSRPGCGNHILREGVGCDRYDRDCGCVFPIHGTDGCCRRTAIHHRHIHIHQDHIKPARLRLPEQPDCLLPVPGLGHLGSAELEQLGADLQVHLIVLSEKDTLAAQHLSRAALFRFRLSLGRLLRHRLHGDCQCEGRAHIRGALHLNLSLHAGHDGLDNRHAQPGPDHCLGAEPVLPGIGGEQLGQEFRRDSHTGILYHNPADLLFLPVGLGDLHPDTVPFPGELHGIGHQIVENLLEPERIHIDPRMPQVKGDLQRLVLKIRLGLEGGQTLADHLTQVAGVVGENQLGLFHPGHLQNAVDELHQLIRRNLDLPEIVIGSGPVPLLLAGQLHRRHNDAQRCAHIMAHL